MGVKSSILEKLYYTIYITKQQQQQNWGACSESITQKCSYSYSRTNSQHYVLSIKISSIFSYSLPHFAKAECILASSNPISLYFKKVSI